MDFNLLALHKLIEDCLVEDIGTGDLTTNSIVPAAAVTTGFMIAKQDGTIAGMPVAAEVFRCLDPSLHFYGRVTEGEAVEKGRVLAELHGAARAILTAERLALNFLQRLSGIATKTAQLVRLLEGTHTYLADTRKTTPGLRMLEKYAVRVGGGHNHRFGLYDAVLIKDNHINFAGGITEAVMAAKLSCPHTAKIEVEVENLVQLQEALESQADIIMLDNMSLSMMREAVELVAGRALLEASGGISGENIRAVADTGVDLISMGALTHSAPSLDISLDLLKIKTPSA